ncbi:MAG TPA: nuclear transport factor 2 family protein [Telluria sp.]|nr:nuclear transport factor 2 family protein [Telluria sp.]
MHHEEQLSLINRYMDAYNAFDIDGMLATLSPGIRFENYSGDAMTASATGVEEFRELAEHAKQIFAEREQRIVELQTGDDAIVATIAWRGTLADGIPDGPPAGTVLEMQGTSEFAFDGALISRIIDRS